MKKLKYSLAALALVVLAACDKSEMPGYLSDPDAVRIEAAVGALTKSNPLGAQDEQKKFNDGDRIAVTNAGKTVVYKLQSGTWAPENSSEYLKWDKSDLKFTAKYPADYNKLPENQSTIANLALADYMEGTADYGTDGIPTGHILSINLERKNVLVKIKIAGYLDQYKVGETYIGSVSFVNGVIPFIQNEKGKHQEYGSLGMVDYTYSAILEPNNGNQDAYFIAMLLKIGNQDVGPINVKGVPELKAGHAYTFELYIGKETVKVGNVTVNEWTTGVALPDGETDPVDTWDGQTVSAFATKDTDGSTLGMEEDNPILISSCAQLAYLSKQVGNDIDYAGKYFKLTDDLNLAGYPWSPIGTSDKPFKGYFDGAGHEIMGLKVNANHHYLGLFGYFSYAILKNLKISSADINSTGDYAAILCAIAEGATISNCSVSGKVRIEHMTAGGIAAELRNTVMTNCTAEVEVTSKQNVGGLCGRLKCAHIEKCTVLPGSTVGVISYVNIIPIMGGLIGCISNEGNDVSQIGDCSTYAKVSGFGNVGGGDRLC